MIRSAIAGIGSYVPPKVVTNDDLAQMMTTSDEWIQTRTGIRERRYADEGIKCSDLALEACRRALDDAQMTPADIDFLILATLSPDHHFPGTACYLQPKLGTGPIGCLDVRNQCTGFLYSLTVADALIRAGIYRNILIVGSEVHSSALDFSDRGRDVTVLFGDGAAAVVLSPSPSSDRGVLYTELHADGRFARALCMDIWDISKKPYLSEKTAASADIWPQMDGKTVFKHAVTRLCEVIQHTLDVNGLKGDDIKYVIPHQANMRINQMVAQRLGFPEEKFLHNMQRYGNTTAASIPLLLDETYRNGMLQAGDMLLLAAFGSGFTWGTAVVRWSR
ncbi:beta-ketoacyl-ACP synthase III [Desulfosoma caldarium]|uniref:Beta-ketoacyl-[acyl-carrier-protein] synthase III n=1 Tax=Desulfosoma caldarium TaxID=610254 RepID=A0A3N1UYF0_9BACT|nr:beta-ketoacyl-ACP synthase III [Desulfosoma caldarium]ROQ92316.1 3-oxoacyl-[acyl-carrier-protein] synthase III [Desulfosoma caldarium]